MTFIPVTPGSGRNVATVQDSGSVDHPLGVMEFMVSAVPTQVSSSNPFPVTIFAALPSGSNTIGAVNQAGSWTVTANAGSGTFAVVGNVASGVADSGNPVKIGGVYNSSAPTLTNSERGDLQLDANGNVKVAIASGGGSGGTASSFGAAFPAVGTAIGAMSSSGSTMASLNLDASGFLKVNVAAGSGGNGAAGNTGSSVPTQADYQGLNVGGTLRGQTGVNPTGSIYASQIDISSVGGSSFGLGQQLAASSIPVVLTAAQITTLTPLSTITANAGTGNFIVVGNVASGASDSGDPVKVGGIYNSSGVTLSNAERGDLQLDASGFLKVNVSAGSSGNAAASATGSVVPADADYVGLNVSGTLRGRTGVNPTGSVYAAQTDLSSVGGISVTLGQTTMSASIPVAIASNQSGITVNAGTNLNTSSLALDTSVNGLLVAQASTTSGQDGPLIQAAVTTSSPSYTTAKTSPLSLTTAGALRVDASATTQPVSGTFWQTTQPVSGTVTVNAGTGSFTVAQTTAANLNATIVGTGTLAVQSTLQAGTNVVGVVISADQTGAIYSGTTSVTPASAYANATASGANVVLAGTSGKKIRVVSYAVGPVSVAVNIYFYSSGGTIISSTKYLAANGGMGRSYNPNGHFDTLSGEGLSINLSTSANVGVDFEYILV